MTIFGTRCGRRTAAVLSLATALTLGGTVLSAAAAPAPSPWSQPGFNAALSQANTAESVLTPSTVTKVTLQHTIDVSHAENECYASAPGVAVAGGRTYVADGTSVSAFTTGTGARVWHASLAYGVASDQDLDAVYLSHGLVLVTGDECGTNDPNAVVAALDAKTGAREWVVDADGDGASGTEVTGNLVVVHTPAGIESVPQDHVFSVTTGKPVWSTSFAESDNLCDVEVGVVDHEVFQQSCPGGDATHEKLQALDVGTGAVLWSKAGQFSVLRGDSDAAGGQNVFLRNDATGLVSDVDPGTGTVRHVYAHATGVWAVTSNLAWGPCLSGKICAWQLASGTRVWTASAGSATGAVLGGSVLYLSDGRALNASTGAMLTTLPAAPVLVANGRLASSSGTTDTVRLYGL